MFSPAYEGRALTCSGYMRLYTIIILYTFFHGHFAVNKTVHCTILPLESLVDGDCATSGTVSVCWTSLTYDVIID